MPFEHQGEKVSAERPVVGGRMQKTHFLNFGWPSVRGSAASSCAERFVSERKNQHTRELISTRNT